MSNKISLPQEIIIEILFRLPNISLLRFQSVSKTWFSWISSLEFAKLRHQNRVFLITSNHHVKLQPKIMEFKSLMAETCRGDASDQKLEITHHDFLINHIVHDLRFVGSCNGLISVVNYPSFDYFSVLNPTTSQFRELPILEPTPMGLGYYGLGYDSRIDDYKIIRGAYSKIEIFNLKKNSWRTIEDLNWCYVIDRGVYLNGFLHWLIGTYKGDESGYKYEMVRFSLAKEKFEDIVTLGNQIDHGILNGDIKIIDGCLCVYTESSATYFGVWKMIKYGVHDSWRRVYYFRDETMHRFNRWNRLLYVTMAGNLLFETEGKFLIVYNPTEKKAVKLCVDQDWYLAEAIIYIESFVSPNISTGKAMNSESSM